MPDRQSLESKSAPEIGRGAGAGGPARTHHRIEIGEIQNPLLRKGLDLWARMRGYRRFPARSDLSPRDMASLLRNTALVRVLKGGEEYEFRIVGDAIVQAQWASLQGLTMREVDSKLPGYGSALRSGYRAVFETREPLAYRGWFERSADKRAFFHESLVLPLGTDGKTVDHLLIIGVYAHKYDGAPS